MDAHRTLGGPDKREFSGSKKYSTSVRDIKKKLSCVNKRINDLHHQRKFNYKNSIKVKKMVHNQINQIVKCFRVRERIICSEVDEGYFSHDANISDDISRLQSVYAHCLALFNHIEDFKEKSDVLKTIDSILSEINLGEKLEVKPLAFVSDFEMMKVKANSYGYLEGDFVKKDDFVYVAEDKDNKLSDENFKPFHDKELINQNCSTPNSSNQKSPLYKSTDCDDFQIIDLLDNMNCQDIDDDFVMDLDENLSCKLQTKNKLSELSSSRSENTFRIKEYNTLKNSPESHETNIDFNPEEEWKQILEMNKKIASWPEISSKGTINDLMGKEKLLDKDSVSCRILLPKETDVWLHSSKNVSRKDEASEKTKNGINPTSPAEVIRRSFKSYLVKDNIKDWLLAY